MNDDLGLKNHGVAECYANVVMSALGAQVVSLRPDLRSTNGTSAWSFQINQPRRTHHKPGISNQTPEHQYPLHEIQIHGPDEKGGY
jgi:hypothetical protein